MGLEVFLDVAINVPNRIKTRRLAAGRGIDVNRGGAGERGVLVDLVKLRSRITHDNMAGRGAAGSGVHGERGERVKVKSNAGEKEITAEDEEGDPEGGMQGEAGRGHGLVAEGEKERAHGRDYSATEEESASHLQTRAVETWKRGGTRVSRENG